MGLTDSLLGRLMNLNLNLEMQLPQRHFSNASSEGKKKVPIMLNVARRNVLTVPRQFAL